MSELHQNHQIDDTMFTDCECSHLTNSRIKLSTFYTRNNYVLITLKAVSSSCSLLTDLNDDSYVDGHIK